MANAAPEWSGLDEETAGGRYVLWDKCAPHSHFREYNIMGRATFIDLAGSERLKHTNSKGKVVPATIAMLQTLLFFPGAH